VRPAETTRAVFEFLDVDPTFTPGRSRSRIGPGFRSPSGCSTSSRPGRGSIDFCRAAIPSGFSSPGHSVRLLGECGVGQARKQVFNPSTRRALPNRYRDDIRRTED
jgi:hypothetical protein